MKTYIKLLSLLCLSHTICRENKQFIPLTTPDTIIKYAQTIQSPLAAIEILSQKTDALTKQIKDLSDKFDKFLQKSEQEKQTQKGKNLQDVTSESIAIDLSNLLKISSLHPFLRKTTENNLKSKYFAEERDNSLEDTATIIFHLINWDRLNAAQNENKQIPNKTIQVKQQDFSIEVNIAPQCEAKQVSPMVEMWESASYNYTPIPDTCTIKFSIEHLPTNQKIYTSDNKFEYSKSNPPIIRVREE